MNSFLTRRRFLARLAAAGLGAATVSLLPRLPGATPVRAGASRPLFDGKTLTGWRAVPRLPVPRDARFESIPPEELKAAVVKWYAERSEQQRGRLKHLGRFRFHLRELRVFA